MARPPKQSSNNNRPPGELPDHPATNHLFEDEDIEETPEEWLVPPADRHKQSTKLIFQVPPYVKLMIEKVVAGKKFPYQYDADFLRHAVYRHLVFLSRRDPSLANHDLVIMQAMSTTLAEEKRVKESLACMYELDRMVERMIHDNDVGRAYKLLRRMAELIQMLPQSATKNKFLSQYSRKYGDFMRSGGKMAPEKMYVDAAGIDGPGAAAGRQGLYGDYIGMAPGEDEKLM